MNNFDDIPFSSEEFEDIPFSSEKKDENIVPQVTDNNILFFDDRIKDIPAKDTKITFKRPSIIIPVLAFVFVSILGMYLFISNSKANSINLIRISENNKFGYIDSEGTLITKAKYTYGSNYYKGYAIVRNNNNLYGVLNGKGVLEVPFGNYYYIGLFNDRYIVSKITKEGLKQALLDSKLDQVTEYKYDSISYAKGGMYLFTRNETMGILNKDGKEIYSFKVDEVDDQNIDVEISEVTSNTKYRYAKVKVNNSSTIINLSTGKEVYKYTLSDIHVLKNNVFYIKAKEKEENNTYIVIKDDDIKLKTNDYKRVKIDDIDSSIAIGISEDTSVSYINLNNKKIINASEDNDYYYGDGIVLEKKHDFDLNKEVYNIITARGTEGSFTDYTPVTNEFSNDVLRVKAYDENYSYIGKDGKTLNDKTYNESTDFNEYGYAIVARDNNYGILNKKGKEKVELSYIHLDFLDNDIFNVLKDNYNKELFVYQDKNNNYGFINNKSKVEIEAIYDNIKYITDKYPIVLVSYTNDKLLLNLSTGKELPIKINSSNIDIENNYIVIDNDYYNYSGKLIYKEK